MQIFQEVSLTFLLSCWVASRQWSPKPNDDSVEILRRHKDQVPKSYLLVYGFALQQKFSDTVVKVRDHLVEDALGQRFFIPLLPDVSIFLVTTTLGTFLEPQHITGSHNFLQTKGMHAWVDQIELSCLTVSSFQSIMDTTVFVKLQKVFSQVKWLHVWMWNWEVKSNCSKSE